MANMTNVQSTLKPEYVPQDGYNQEYRQNPTTSDGYIYSHAGADFDNYTANIQPYMPQSLTFGSQCDATNVNMEATPPGHSTVPGDSVIFPFPGEPPAGLPLKVTVQAGNVFVDLLLIARTLEHTTICQLQNSDGSTLTWSKCEIQRRTISTQFKGSVLSVVVDDEGSRYALVASFSSTYDPNQIDGLKDLPLPPGYTYESYLLAEDFVLRTAEVAQILVCADLNFQRFEKPIPAS
jgi:hypothetical protein